MTAKPKKPGRRHITTGAPPIADPAMPRVARTVTAPGNTGELAALLMECRDAYRVAIQDPAMPRGERTMAAHGRLLGLPCSYQEGDPLTLAVRLGPRPEGSRIEDYAGRPTASECLQIISDRGMLEPEALPDLRVEYAAWIVAAGFNVWALIHEVPGAKAIPQTDPHWLHNRQNDLQIAAYAVYTGAIPEVRSGDSLYNGCVVLTKEELAAMKVLAALPELKRMELWMEQIARIREHCAGVHGRLLTDFLKKLQERCAARR